MPDFYSNVKGKVTVSPKIWAKATYFLIRSEISRFNIYNSQAIINTSPAISLAHFKNKSRL